MKRLREILPAVLDQYGITMNQGDREMTLFIYHIPSGQAFTMLLTEDRYDLVEGKPNKEIQDVPFVEREISRRFGDKPHFLDVQCTVCAMLDKYK